MTLQGISKLTGNSEQLEKLKSFEAHVLKWNRKISLVSRKDSGAVLRRLILHSLKAANQIPEDIETIVDIGTGAGLPGIPLAIVSPERKFILVERSDKKCSFLKNTISRLGLSNTTVINDEYRPEQLPDKGKTAVTTLGVGQYIVLIDSLRHYLKRGGGFLFFVNKDFAQELACHVSCETFEWECLSQGTTTGVLWLPV